MCYQPRKDYRHYSRTVYLGQGNLISETVHVLDRPFDSHRKTGVVRSPLYKTHTVATQAHWHISETLDKINSLQPHLECWLDKGNVLLGKPLHLLGHPLQLFTVASNKGWGTHLRDNTARDVWSDTESHLHINALELKAVLLDLKSFEHICRVQIVLVATDNTTVVSYINKEGGMKSV